METQIQQCQHNETGACNNCLYPIYGRRAMNPVHKAKNMNRFNHLSSNISFITVGETADDEIITALISAWQQ